MSKTYLISGRNRGIGKGLVSKLLSRPETTVIALYDAACTDSPFRAFKAIEPAHNIHTSAVVLANRDIISQWGLAAGVKTADLESHFRINAVAPILLFQAPLPLIQKSPHPEFFIISSTSSSIAKIPGLPFDAVAYGMSKVAVNYAMRKLLLENPAIVVQPICPGWVKMGLGQFAVDNYEVVEEQPLEVEESVAGLLRQMDGSTEEGTSRRFFASAGEGLPW